jgi:arylsulfatase A-like enzyme
MYEGGIREPLIARWPAKIKPGSVSDVPVCSVDFFPTFLEASGAKAPEGLKIDGASLIPVLTGGSLPERALFWHYPHYGNQGGAPAAAIRRGNHKLIHWFEEDRVELFDLSTDLSEKNDLALARPDLVDALGAELKGWQEDVGAKFPSPNPNFDPAKPSGRAAGGKPGTPAAVKGKK